MPNVRLARFHKESLPSLLSLPGGGAPAASSGVGACDISAVTYSALGLLLLKQWAFIGRSLCEGGAWVLGRILGPMIGPITEYANSQ